MFNTDIINIVKYILGGIIYMVDKEWLKMLSYREELKKFTRIFIPQWQNNKLTSSELEVLSLLFIIDESTLINLSQQSGMKKEAVSRTLKQLLIKGYIRKERDSEDKRSYIISLTNKGTEVLKENQSNILKPFYELKRNMGEDFDKLFELITKAAENK